MSCLCLCLFNNSTSTPDLQFQSITSLQCSKEFCITYFPNSCKLGANYTIDAKFRPLSLGPLEGGPSSDRTIMIIGIVGALLITLVLVTFLILTKLRSNRRKGRSASDASTNRLTDEELEEYLSRKREAGFTLQRGLTENAGKTQLTVRSLDNITSQSTLAEVIEIEPKTANSV